MRNVRVAKRPHAKISNLEDPEVDVQSKGQTSKITCATTSGLMKPPVDFMTSSTRMASPKRMESEFKSSVLASPKVPTIKLEKPAAKSQKADDKEESFSDLEDMLEEALAS